MKKIVIEIPHYQVTAVIALLLALHAITFVAGYFWGKKSALEEFAEQIKQESFSDKVYASLCSLYEQNSEVHNDSSGDFAKSLPDAHAHQSGPCEQPRSSSEQREEKHNAEKTPALFIAQLIGYGSEKQAYLYRTSLERRGISAQVCARTSVSARGKTKSWYQVVTKPASYQETEQLAERLALEDRLAGVCVVEVLP